MYRGGFERPINRRIVSSQTIIYNIVPQLPLLTRSSDGVEFSG